MDGDVGRRGEVDFGRTERVSWRDGELHGEEGAGVGGALGTVHESGPGEEGGVGGGTEVREVGVWGVRVGLEFVEEALCCCCARGFAEGHCCVCGRGGLRWEIGCV